MVVQQKLILTLPRLVSSREAAAELVRSAGELRGHDLLVKARELRAASPSAVDELVRVALIEQGASRLLLSNAGSKFAADVSHAAEVHDVAAQVSPAP